MHWNYLEALLRLSLLWWIFFGRSLEAFLWIARGSVALLHALMETVPRFLCGNCSVLKVLLTELLAWEVFCVYCSGRCRLLWSSSEALLCLLLGDDNGHKELKLRVIVNCLHSPRYNPYIGQNVLLSCVTDMRNRAKQQIKSNINFWGGFEHTNWGCEVMDYSHPLHSHYKGTTSSRFLLTTVTRRTSEAFCWIIWESVCVHCFGSYIVNC